MKRFGRNQKRKLNEKIKQLDDKLFVAESNLDNIHSAYRLEKELVKALSKKVDYYEHVFKNVEEVLGEYFIGLPAKEKENVFAELPAEWRECLPPKMRAIDISAKPHPEMILNTVKVLSRYKFESHRDQLQQKRHFYLTQRNQDFLAYYVTEEEFRKIPFDELVQIIAKLFANHIKNGKQ